MALAFSIRIGFFLLEKPWDPVVEKEVILINDALGYHGYAVKLLENGSFESVGDFSLRRTPGYPVYLAFIYSFVGAEPWVVLFSQILISLGILYLIWKLASDWFDYKVAAIATLLYAIEPHAILHSLVLLPDTLFAFVALLASYLFFNAIKESPNLKMIALSGILLALGVYLKPIGQFLPFVFIALLIIRYWRSLRSVAVPSIVIVIAFSATLAPWMARNYVVYDNFKLSDKGGEHLLRWVATYVEVAQTGESPSVIRQRFMEQALERGYAEATNPFDRSSIQGAIALEYIKDHPIEYAQQHIKGVAYTFLNLGTKRIAQLLGIESNDVGFHFFAAPSVWESTKIFLTSKSYAEIAIGLYVAAILFLTYFLTAIGLVRAVIRANYWVLLIFGLTIGYYLALVGPIGLARYKIPFMPFYLIFAGYGAYFLWSKIKIKGHNKTNKVIESHV